MHSQIKIQAEVNQCVRALNAGGTILYPTDTIWGIGCDATNARAVQKILRLKKRRADKSFIILLDDLQKLTLYVKEVPEFAWDLISSIDKPLTIIYPEAKNLAKNVLASDGSIAIRIIKHDFCQPLLASFNKPIVSTSANISGDENATTFSQISQEILKKVDYTVGLFQNELNTIKPSTIIKFNNSHEFNVIRD